MDEKYSSLYGANPRQIEEQTEDEIASLSHELSADAVEFVISCEGFQIVRPEFFSWKHNPARKTKK